MPGKVVWHALVTPDMNKAKNFYAGLLGWTFEDVSDGCALVRHNGRFLAGIAKLDLSGRTKKPLLIPITAIWSWTDSRASV